MNQLSSIKERLKNFNDTEFQELCDSFLSLRNRNYKAFSRTGAHDIKQKTTRNNPDSFIQMPNGLYLFVETTTTEHKGKRLLDKLKADISGCLNVAETKIPVHKVQEIILCYNSNLKASEIEEVNEKALQLMGKPPMHYNLDALANEIFFHHKNLAHDYLSLPLDTGQVVSLEKFIEEYDNGKQKLATPLAGTFLHRHNELRDVQSKLITNDIVIISGPAGVGKSKLALESIKQFIQSHLDYNAFAISPKGADLLGDLSSYFDGEENSLLLVDDVNRVDKFEQILGFYRGLKRGKLKLILTVRDYALENIREWLSAYENSIVEINRMDYEEIKAILEQEPFGIHNGKYQYKIHSIVKGNARLAVMMAMIAKKTNTLESLNNVADVFEQYFETFVSDENAFKDKKILKSLGILSFFYTIPYNDGELLDSVASSFSISSDDLREAFDKLHALDLIELNYRHVRIGEQNLSTYFFYKVFIKEELLSFKSLCDNYFEKQLVRFMDTVYPVYDNFDAELTSTKIKPALLSYWSNAQLDKDKAFRFMKFAWKFIPSECLDYLEESIASYNNSGKKEFKTEYANNDFVGSNSEERHLHLLAYFFKNTTTVEDSIYLSFRFVEQNSEHLPQLVYHLDSNLTFTDEDHINQFERQKIFVDYLIEQTPNGKMYALTFFAVSRKILKWLRWTYKQDEKIEKDDPKVVSAKSIRGGILTALIELFVTHPSEVFEVILDFSVKNVRDNKYTFEFDLTYLIPWIDNNLTKSDFKHSYLVQEIIRSSKKIGLDHSEFNRLRQEFTNSTYSLFELVNWDRRRGKDDYDFENYNEFEALKKADITSKLTFKSENDIIQFITRYREIIEWDTLNIHTQYYVLDAIVKANLEADLDTGFKTFMHLAKLQDEGSFNSQVFISNVSTDRLAINERLAERFWEAIELEGLNKIWKLEILTSLPQSTIKPLHLSRLYEVLKELKQNFYISYDRLSKYKQVEPKIVFKVLKTVVDKIENENLNIRLDKEFFKQAIDSIEDLSQIKRGYIQQDQLDHHFDFDGKILIKILQKDGCFLLEFITGIMERDLYTRSHEHRELSVVWELSNPENLIDDVVKYLSEIDNYLPISEHFANSFFQTPMNNTDKADNYLLSLIERYNANSKIIHIVLDIIHNSRSELLEKALMTYLYKNQDVECFKKIKWIKSQVVFSGDDNVNAIRAAKWERLLGLVKSAKLGVKTRAIRSYIKRERDSYLRSAEEEKRRKFLTGF